MVSPSLGFLGLGGSKGYMVLGFGVLGCGLEFAIVFWKEMAEKGAIM